MYGSGNTRQRGVRVLQVWRYCLSLGFISLCAWLAYDFSRAHNLQTTIMHARQEGLIGGLSPRETRELFELVAAVKDLLRISTPHYINERPSPTHIDVLTYSPGVDSFPALRSLKPGNAAYHSRTDAIFLPLAQVRAALNDDPESPLAGPQRLFLVLTVLHEFGHRHFDGGQHGFFDSGSDSRDREIRADRFAHEAFVKMAHSADPLSRILFRSVDAPAAIEGEPDPFNDPRSLVALYVQNLSEIYSRTGNDFSSFYQSENYPRLIDRLGSLLDVSIDSTASNSGSLLARELKFARYLIGLYGAPDRILCEVRTSGPILSFRWHDGILKIVTTNGIEEFAVGTVLKSDRNTYRTYDADLTCRYSVPHDLVAATFGNEGMQFVLTAEGQVLRHSNSGFTTVMKIDGDYWRHRTIGSVASPLVLARGPSTTAIYHTHSSYILFISGDDAWTYDLRDIRRHLRDSFELNAHNAAPNRFVLSGLASNGFFVAPAFDSEAHERIPVLKIMRETASGGEAELVILCSEGVNSQSLRIVVQSSDGDRDRFFAVTGHNSSGATLWHVWELFADRRARKVATESFVRQAASDAGLIFFDRLSAAQFRWSQVCNNRLYVDFGSMDPVYEVDLDTGSVRAIYLHSDGFAFDETSGLIALSSSLSGFDEMSSYRICIIGSCDEN